MLGYWLDLELKMNFENVCNELLMRLACLNLNWDVG